jgi:hypothetical protein
MVSIHLHELLALQVFRDKAGGVFKGHASSGEENFSGLWFITPAFGKLPVPSIVSYQAADFRLGQLELTFVVQIILVRTQVLPESERFCYQVPQVFRDVGLEPIIFQDLADPFPADEFYIRDTVTVPENQTYTAGGDPLFPKIEDHFLNCLDIGIGPGRGFFAVGPHRP